MTERFEVTFPLLGGSEERYAYIHLPNSYFHNENKRYPVLYMFDGHNVFLMRMQLTAKAGEWKNI